MKITQDQIVPIESDNGRTYRIDGIGGGIEVPSASTVCSLARAHALERWNYRVGVEETLNLVRLGVDITGLDTKEVMEQIARMDKSPQAQMIAGGDRGTVVHEAMENYALKVSYTPDLAFKPYTDSLEAWIEAYGPIWHAMEQKVASHDLGYAGRYDGIVTITKHPPRRRHEPLIGKRVLLDLKTNTSGSVYSTHTAQVKGYEVAYNRNCEDGDEKVDASIVVAVGPAEGGKPQFATKIATSKDKNVFLALVSLWHAQNGEE